MIRKTTLILATALCAMGVQAQITNENIVKLNTTPSGLNNNAAISDFSLGSYIVGVSASPVVTVLNAGISPIASFDVTVDYNGAQYTRNLTFIDLQPTDSMDIQLVNAFPLIPGSLPVTATVSNVNGAVDDDPSDNIAMLTIDPVVPAAGKVVVAETILGTLSEFSPRGYVFMDKFEQDFGPFGIGIDVHSADSMTFQIYQDGVFGLTFGIPDALVDRDIDVDPSLMQNDLISHLQIAPTAFLYTSSVWNEMTRELRVFITADFQSAANGDYKLAVVLTEDSVTGTVAADYDQRNSYSGGGFGPMDGYEDLPDPVPASVMVYNRVARIIEPSFAGDTESFPAIVNAGDVYTKRYNFTIPLAWDENNITVIGLMMNPSGNIDNASKSQLGENDGSLFKSSFEEL